MTSAAYETGPARRGGRRPPESRWLRRWQGQNECCAGIRSTAPPVGWYGRLSFGAGATGARLDGVFECGNQNRALHAEFGAMVQGEIPQEFLAPGAESEQNFAAVAVAALAMDVTSGGQPVHEFHSAVMLNLQAFGQFAHKRRHAGWKPFQRKHQLMLMGLQTGSACRLFAEAQKAANLVAEFRQRLIVRKDFRFRHIYIVSRYIVYRTGKRSR